MGGGNRVESNSSRAESNIINADFFSHLKPFKKYKTKKPQWQLDLLYPFNCDDCVFDGVFSEHVLEHFYIDDAKVLLKEIHRILKSKGVIRLAVPCLEYAIECYLKRKNNNDSLASEAIRGLTQEYLHLSVWDYERLKYELESIGFVNVQRCQYKQGKNADLLFDLEARKQGNLYVEATKS